MADDYLEENRIYATLNFKDGGQEREVSLGGQAIKRVKEFNLRQIEDKLEAVHWNPM